jgi:O-antigen/teichoic acid export membrane protein
LTGILVKASIGPGEALLTMAGEQMLCVKVYAAALVSLVLLNVTLIPMFGLAGGAWATAGTMIVEAALLHIAVRKRLGIVLFAFVNPSRAIPEVENRSQ